MSFQRLFTIGHSSLAVEVFLDLLLRFGVTAVADVRSSPYSRYVPRYNRETVQQILPASNIEYYYFGDWLGGKPKEPRLYDSAGLVRYDLLRREASFQQGVDELLKLAVRSARLALFCAEEDPFRCHRHHLLARELELERAVQVWHIRVDGTLNRAVGFAENSPRQLSLF
ncbi:MAG: DUF488 domain-containing protein [Deltaproteobacteria bacterium]